MKARACLMWLLAGCGRAATPDPAVALRSYLTALERDDPKAAWASLSSATRAQAPEGDFIARWRASPTERAQQVAWLRARLAGGPPSQWAAVVFTDGTRIPLTHDADGWRLGTTALGEARATTPEEALRAFARAVEERRFDQLLGLLAEPLRGEVERQLRERIERLQAALQKGAAIEVNGDRARLQYDPRFRLDLRRQDGQWRIFDLN